ncbi:MAG: extracellular solute-binding protein [bacterium]
MTNKISKMEIKKRFLFIFLLSAIVVAGGFGCKGLSAEEKQAVQPVSLEYWTVYDDVDQIRTLINQYTADRAYLTVSVRQLREDEIYTRLVEALADDQGPDIISIHNRMLPAYQNKLVPMPASVPDVTTQIVKKKLGTEQIVNMSTVVLPTAWQLESEYIQVVKQDVVSGNNIYGLPLSIDTMALYYNKDMLDRAGVAEPPQTWTDFQKAVKKLTKYDQEGGKIVQSGVALGTGNNVEAFDDLLYILFEQSNVKFNQGNQAIFNTSQQGSEITSAMSVINFYTDFANSIKDTYSWNSGMGDSLNEFVSGKTAFFFGYSYHNSLIKARAPQLNVKILPLLQLDADNPVNSANYWVQSVVKKSNKQDEAWALIAYLTHSKATKDYLDNTGRPSALRAYITEQQQNKELAPFVSQVLVAKNWYRGKSYVSAKSSLSHMLDSWLKVPDDSNKTVEYWQNLLDYTVSQINQTY